MQKKENVQLKITLQKALPNYSKQTRMQNP